MNQRIIDALSQAIYRAMPRATNDQKVAVDQAARAVFAKHFDLCNAEANELDAIIDRLHTELDAAKATIETMLDLPLALRRAAPTTEASA